jgi:hypothetical protein
MKEAIPKNAFFLLNSWCKARGYLKPKFEYLQVTSTMTGSQWSTVTCKINGLDYKRLGNTNLN